MNDNSLGISRQQALGGDVSELDRVMQGHIDSGQFTKEQLAEMRKAEANRLREAKANAEKAKQVEKEATVDKPKFVGKGMFKGKTEEEVLSSLGPLAQTKEQKIEGRRQDN
jgi:ElaB/YqjD/DUF883 family membrane-anchored ribosome-binding protein